MLYSAWVAESCSSRAIRDRLVGRRGQPSLVFEINIVDGHGQLVGIVRASSMSLAS